MAVIAFEQVSKRYGDLVVLREVDFVVEPGEAVLLTGGAGAGKTTFLRLLAAVERPDTGRILVSGRNIARLRRSAVPYLRRNLGVISQPPRIIPEASVMENVAVALEVLGISDAEMAARARRALERVGLGGHAALPAGRLSAGEQLACVVARALVGEPELVLADEPSVLYDSERASLLWELFDQLRGQGATLLMATRDPALVAFGASRLWRQLHLAEGRLVEAPLEALLGKGAGPLRAVGGSA